MPKETLSALLDGECTAEELDHLLLQMERSPELKRSYSRMWLVREAHEGTHITKAQTCICEGVMARLGAQEEVNPKVIDLSQRRREPVTGRPWWIGWKPAMGFAAAASVVAVALLVSMPQQQADNGVIAAQAITPEVSNAQIVPVSGPAQRHARMQAVALSADEAAQMEDLNTYMMEHSNAVSGQAMGGTLRYARFAAHNAAYPQPGDQP